MTPLDAYWEAKRVMAFRDEQIRAIVEEGQFQDPRVVDYITKVLHCDPIVADTALAPDVTDCTPPRSTRVPVATPPAATISPPALATRVATDEPPDCTVNCPPLAR